jgi:tRNA modification GTPase
MQGEHTSPGATNAALLTGAGRSAIATIVVQGPNALAAVADRCCVSGAEFARRTAHGRLWLGRCGSAGEQVVIHVRAIDHVEINCHGGRIPSQIILDDLAHRGVATVPWMLLAEHNAESHVELEAQEALTRAHTLRTAAILLDQLAGALSKVIGDLVKQLPQGESQTVVARLRDLLVFSEFGSHLTAPWRVAIVGRSNVGKSSLLNALVGYDRAIVHSTAGTTRDLVTATTSMDGWPVELADSAGIRAAADEVEAAGVERARQAIDWSDRQLVVFDASTAISAEDWSILRLCPRPLVVANKSDLPAAWSSTVVSGNAISASARTGNGVETIVSQLASVLVPNVPAAGAAVPFTARQVELLRRAEETLRGGDLTLASQWLRGVIETHVSGREH